MTQLDRIERQVNHIRARLDVLEKTVIARLDAIEERNIAILESQHRIELRQLDAKDPYGLDTPD